MDQNSTGKQNPERSDSLSDHSNENQFQYIGSLFDETAKFMESLVDEIGYPDQDQLVAAKVVQIDTKTSLQVSITQKQSVNNQDVVTRSCIKQNKTQKSVFVVKQVQFDRLEQNKIARSKCRCQKYPKCFSRKTKPVSKETNMGSFKSRDTERIGNFKSFQVETFQSSAQTQQASEFGSLDQNLDSFDSFKSQDDESSKDQSKEDCQPGQDSLKTHLNTESQSQVEDQKAQSQQTQASKITEIQAAQINNKSLYSKKEIDLIVKYLQHTWQTQSRFTYLTQQFNSFSQWFESAQRVHKTKFSRDQSAMCKKLVLLTQGKTLNVPVTSWNNYSDAFTSQFRARQCDHCFKFCERKRKNLHEKCFWNGSWQSYRMLKIDHSYICLLCFTTHDSLRGISNHLVYNHHPLDLKFIGLNLNILQRFTTYDREYHRSCFEISGTEVRIKSQGQQQATSCRVTLDDILDDEIPMKALLKSFALPYLSHPMPANCYNIRQMFRNKIYFQYDLNVYSDLLFAGESFEKTLQIMNDLSRIKDFEYYGFTRIENAGSKFNIVKRFDKPIIHLFDSFVQVMQEQPEKISYLYKLVLIELDRLKQKGVYVLEATDPKNWVKDRVKRRVYFFAPHWITQSASKANTIGYCSVQFKGKKTHSQLSGTAGLYLQAVLGFTVTLAQQLSQSEFEDFGKYDDTFRIKPISLARLEKFLTKIMAESSSTRIINIILDLYQQQYESIQVYVNTINAVQELFYEPEHSKFFTQSAERDQVDCAKGDLI